MQQEIKLTNESRNTVFVEDVDVSKGVYAKNKPENVHGINTYIVLLQNNKYHVVALVDTKGWPVKFNSLADVMNHCSYFDFYTIPDKKRIVTEREVTIDDLKNTDHVGFVDDKGNKGHIVCVSGNEGLFTPVTSTASTSFGPNAKNTFEEVKDAVMLENCCDRRTKQIIRFTTRKELYQWLAE